MFVITDHDPKVGNAGYFELVIGYKKNNLIKLNVDSADLLHCSCDLDLDLQPEMDRKNRPGVFF